jgi:hypothetical protein
MPDLRWATRLEVKVGNTRIAPITQFTPRFNTPHTVVHSIDGDNLVYTRGNVTAQFSMSVSAVGTAVAELMELAMKGTEFEVVLAEQTGTDWSLKSITFGRCVILNASHTVSSDGGIPTVTFDCAALKTGVEA